MNADFRNTSRREFLKQSLQTSLALGIAGLVPKSLVAGDKNEAIIIIGAGIAGLAALRTLISQGYTNVAVLEGRDRIGGRMWTDRSVGGIPLDLGAAWTHGIGVNSMGVENPIRALTRQFNITTRNTNYESRALFKLDGAQLTDVEEAELAMASATNEAGMLALKTAPTTTPRTSLLEASNQVIMQNGWSGQLLTNLYWSLSSSIQTAIGANLNEMALLPWKEDLQFPALDGVADVVFPNGYIQVIDGLAQGLMSNIRLSTTVQRIAYNAQGVTVTTDKGVFTGARAIITLPLGVLKAGNVEFSPVLPEDKQTAISRLGSGTLNKIAMQFPSKFWGDSEYAGLALAPENRARNMEFWNWHFYTGTNVLVGLAGGEYARSWETRPQATAVNEVMGYLRTMYGASAPDPIAVAITKWNSDPFARGSYSFRALGSSLEDNLTIAAPVANRLFFAGEHTANQYPGTVHGAYLMGIRAANEVAQTPTSTREAAPTLASLRCYPNPSAEDVEIAYTLPKAGAVRISLVSNDGKIATTILSTRQQAGEQRLRYHLRQHPAGQYFVRLESEAGQLGVIPLLVVR